MKKGVINMKKALSLILALVLLMTALAVAPIGVSAAAVFQEGDEIYLRIESPSSWIASGTLLYANFTDASREDFGGTISIRNNPDPERIKPVRGAAQVSTNFYRYTVTADDTGASVMRFWRGSNSQLWNDSVKITADDLIEGKNTVVVTDWSNTGYLTSTYDYDMTVDLTLSAASGEVGDSFDITVTNSAVPNATVSYAVYINDELFSSAPGSVFTPSVDGIYAVKAVVTATNSAGRVVAYNVSTASIMIGSAPVTALAPNCLYAHAAVDDAQDSEAWVKWYDVDDVYYFFLPSSAKAYDQVELYSTLSDTASMNGVEIPVNGAAVMNAEAGKTYRITVGEESKNVQFLFSSAEAALWINNTEAYSGFKDFFAYLQADKSNSVAATGAVSTPDGKIESTDVKKMKGRGNTSWNADKKGFNVTFQNAIQLAGLQKCKKFSLISNFQDAAMARNRILFDLSDEVGIPYSSDSRFIDLYTNGVYQGTYQICQKVDVGKNTLVDDFEEDDYLDAETGGVKSDFSFVAEIDSSPAADDFHFTVSNGNNLTMKAPELETSDKNYTAVRNYIRDSYNTMYSHIGSADVNNYIDVNSLAKVYIINELGKNWDSGASSFYLTYKPDSDGTYKYFASPVWDYDNSLGNANGVSGDLRNLGISDYTSPTGWFASKKNGYNGPNFLAEAVKNSVVMDEVRRVWFEDFLPALDILTSSGVTEGEIWSSEVYADYLRDSAAMNYKIWELVTNTGWIADHSSLRKYSATYTRNSYGQVTGVSLSQDSRSTTYDQYTFDGQFDYMMDWTTSRAAWISSQYISDYKPSEPVIPTEPATEAPTEAPTTPPEDVIEPDLTDAIAAWVFDPTDKAEGDKLTEYGSADDGYAATVGEGRLSLTVSGEKSRALEWSAPEYGVSGTLMTPIMAAGSKNPWGDPYIRMEVPTKGYDSLTLTMYLAGSNKAPASWKLQYSVDGRNFADIDGAVFTISPENRKKLTAYFDKSMLPDFEYSFLAENLILQLVPVSMTTINGGNALDAPSSGEIALNCIVIQGHKVGTDEIVLGDTDLSDEVEIVDATIIQRHLVDLRRLNSKSLVSGDVDRDGELTIADVTAIQRALIGVPNPYLTLDIE